jgi:hypothetical protein
LEVRGEEVEGVSVPNPISEDSEENRSAETSTTILARKNRHK